MSTILFEDSNYSIKRLNINDLHKNLLDDFNRYQKVNQCIRKENDQWIYKNISFTEQWDNKKRQEIIIEYFYDTIKNGGDVLGIFNKLNQLIGFSNLSAKLFGNKKQYIQLKQLHISYEYRNQGLGKKLFLLCIEKAKDLGAKKIYISTSSAKETQIFYEKMGCMDAIEINSELAEEEPCDRQMEYIIN
jgi:N-acetylglutamate synthase-like GNAT family acetyltransferase